MNRNTFLGGILTVGVVAAFALAADYPFSDNFSDSNQTKKNWSVMQYQKDSVIRTCANGVYTVTNLQKSGSALVYHEFITSKTPTFTASCAITRPSDTVTAGMFLCLSIPTTTGYLTGYSVIIKNSFVSLNKNGASSVYLDGAPFRSLSTDTLKVSRQANTIKVFCNGVFLFGYTDNAILPPGDFGLVVKSPVSVVFDNVLFIDQFTDGNYPVCMSDNFNNGAIGPNWVLDPAGDFAENDSVLAITVPKAGQAICYARAAIGDTFAARLIVSNEGGDSSSFYGLMLYGFDTSNSMQILSFGISGDQFGKAYLPGVGFYPRYKPQIINGSVFPYYDTIDVIRSTGSNKIIMYVNGYPLDTMVMSSFNFVIVGAGIFNNGGVKIFANDFHIGPTLGECPVNSVIRKNQQILTYSFNRQAGKYLFDPLGRKVGQMSLYGNVKNRTLAPGFYVSNNGRSGVVVKKK